MEQGQVENCTIESLIKEMEERRGTPPSTPSEREPKPACLISWVDDKIRVLDRSQYEPYEVLIGPFHRNPSHWMELEKKNLLHSALPTGDEREQVLRGWLRVMEDLERRARGCYDTTFSEITREAFACMLLLDGCFLLSCFLPVLGSSEVPSAYESDVIFLLGNQVPFFILEEICKRMVTVDEYSSTLVVVSIARHIQEILDRYGYVHSNVRRNSEWPDPCHLVHLLHMYFWPTVLGQHPHRPAPSSSIPSPMNGPRTSTTNEVHVPVPNSPTNNNNTSSNNGGNTQAIASSVLPPARWRSASFYYHAGIRLAKLDLDGDKACSILDVAIRDHDTLRIPRLMIDNNTWRILRNMVALEQHNPDIGSHVTDYCLFMSQVANTEKDVTLLSDKGILVHFLTKDSDVANGFADLCRGIVFNANSPDANYLRPIQVKLERLCRSHWRKSTAWLRHNKCSNILMALAVAAAITAFLCTVEQSILTALSYAKGK